MKMSARIKSSLWPSIHRLIPWRGRVSFSQFGEDMALDWLTRGQASGFYVDIGAYHPIALSNTYALYTRGWQGINIEPRSETHRHFNLYRPRDINLSIGICAESGVKRDFYVFADPAFSTMDVAQAKEYKDRGQELIRVDKVVTKTLADVLNEHAPKNAAIDLLSVDVEGLDEEVLRSNDWSRWRPRLLAFERQDLGYFDVAKDTVVQWLTSIGYEMVTKCGHTLIMAVSK